MTVYESTGASDENNYFFEFEILTTFIQKPKPGPTQYLPGAYQVYRHSQGHKT